MFFDNKSEEREITKLEVTDSPPAKRRCLTNLDLNIGSKLTPEKLEKLEFLNVVETNPPPWMVPQPRGTTPPSAFPGPQLLPPLVPPPQLPLLPPLVPGPGAPGQQNGIETKPPPAFPMQMPGGNLPPSFPMLNPTIPFPPFLNAPFFPFPFGRDLKKFAGKRWGRAKRAKGKVDIDKKTGRKLITAITCVACFKAKKKCMYADQNARSCNYCLNRGINCVKRIDRRCQKIWHESGRRARFIKEKNQDVDIPDDLQCLADKEMSFSPQPLLRRNFDFQANRFS